MNCHCRNSHYRNIPVIITTVCSSFGSYIIVSVVTNLEVHAFETGFMYISDLYFMWSKLPKQNVYKYKFGIEKLRMQAKEMERFFGGFHKT